MIDSALMTISTDYLLTISVWTGLSEQQLQWGMASVGVVLCLWWLIKGYRKTRLLHQKVERLQHDLLVANNSAIGMGQQLLTLEKKLNTQYQAETNIHHHKQALETKVSQLKNVEAIKPQTKKMIDNEADSELIYEKARMLLLRGLDISTVIKNTGLSHAEVSLIAALHKGHTPTSSNIHSL